MNYTTNYHLPQWAETDRIMMEDFNDAMASIETGLSEGLRMDCVTISTAGKVSGDTIYTFPEPPRFVFMRGLYDSAILPAGGTTRMVDYLGYYSEYVVKFQLSGTNLIMTERDNSSSASELILVPVY